MHSLRSIPDLENILYTSLYSSGHLSACSLTAETFNDSLDPMHTTMKTCTLQAPFKF